MDNKVKLGLAAFALLLAASLGIYFLLLNGEGGASATHKSSSGEEGQLLSYFATENPIQPPQTESGADVLSEPEPDSPVVLEPSGSGGTTTPESTEETPALEQDACAQIGLSASSCSDDGENLLLFAIDGEEIYMDGVSFSLSDEDSTGGDGLERKGLSLKDVSGATLRNVKFTGDGGEIIIKELPFDVVYGETSISPAFRIEKNDLGVDSSKYPELNQPAHLKFTGVYGLKDAYPLRNGAPCGTYCSNFAYDEKKGRASMDVSGFSNYSIGGINISQAIHLDSTYAFVSDITSQVKDKDNVWSEQILVGEFARATFEQNLTNGKVIDVYARKGGASNVYFNVYKNGTTSPLLGTSGPLTDSGSWIYITIESLSGSADTFDFEMMGDSGGYVEFDYIHDVDVSGCTNISYPGTYVLTQNLTGAPYYVGMDMIGAVNYTCILIESSDVTLDCNGYSIMNDGTGDASGIAINGTNTTRLENIEIKNCFNISSYENGITVNGGENATIRNTSITNITVDSVIATGSRYCLFTNLSMYDVGGGVGFSELSLYNNATNINVRESTICIGSSIASNYSIFDSIICNNTEGEGAIGLWALVSSNITISNSVFSGFGTAVFADRSEDVFAYNNTILNSTTGILAETTSYISIQTHILGNNNTIYNVSNALDFSADTYYIDINITNTTLLPNSGTYENYSVIDIHDVLAPGNEYSVKWSGGPASFNDGLEANAYRTFNRKFLNITSNSAQTIHRFVWSWNSSEATGFYENRTRMVQNASASDRTIFSEIPDTGNHSLTVDSLQLNPQTDNFGLFDEQYCGTISASGTYTLSEDAIGAPTAVAPYGAAWTCINIAASNVLFDCAGYGVYNVGADYHTNAVGILVNNGRTNVTIQNCKNVELYEKGVYSWESNNVTIQNVTSNNNTEHNVYLREELTAGPDVSFITINGSTFYGGPTNLDMDTFNGQLNVWNNSILNATSNGIYFAGGGSPSARYSIKENNIIGNAAYGIVMYGSGSDSGSIISENNISGGSTACIRVYGYNYGNWLNLLIFNNTLEDCYRGVYMVPSNSGVDHDNTVSWNRIHDVDIGVQLSGSLSYSNNIHNNTISNASYGFYISSSSTTSRIYDNDLFNITTYAAYFDGAFPNSDCAAVTNNDFKGTNTVDGEAFYHYGWLSSNMTLSGYDLTPTKNFTNLGVFGLSSVNNVTFKDSTLRNGINGLYMCNVDNSVVSNVTLINNGASDFQGGIAIYSGFINVTITNVTATGGYAGVNTFGGTDLTVKDSTFYGLTGFGFRSESGSGDNVVGFRVNNNTIYDVPIGVYFWSLTLASLSSISNNTIHGVTSGIHFRPYNYGDVLSINVTYNYVYDATRAYYYEGYNGATTGAYFLFEGNNCTNSTYCHYISPSGVYWNSTYRNNRASDCQYGLYMSGSGTDDNYLGFYDMDLNATVYPIYFAVQAGNPTYFENVSLRNDITSNFVYSPSATYLYFTNLTMKRNLGAIQFLPTINPTTSLSSSAIKIDSDIASINSATYTYFQIPANVTTYASACPATIYWKDGFPTSSVEISATGSSCPGDRCYSAVCADNLVNFTVSNFSGYTANITAVPTLENVTLNSTYGTNLTTENLTLWYDSSPGSINITAWYINGVPIMALNMPFEGSGGSESSAATDYSGYGRNGSVVNAAWSQTGGYDGFGTYNFTGSAYVSTGAWNVTGNKITMMAWIKPSPGTGQVIIGKSHALTHVSPYYKWVLYKGGSNVLSFRIDTSTFDSPTNQIVDGEWQHVAGVYDGSMMRIYHNGVQVASLARTADIQTSDREVRIGARHTSTMGEYFTGYIDEARVYQAALSPEQIFAIYNNESRNIHFRETRQDENWSACVTPNNGYLDGLANCSNNLTIARLAVENVTLVSSSGGNSSEENITIDYGLINGSEFGTINWYKNGTSIMLLNMPFEAYSGAAPMVAKDYSPYGKNGSIHGPTWSSTGGHNGLGAYSCDGTNDYINSTQVPPATVATVNIWFKAPVSGQLDTNGVIFGQMESSSLRLWAAILNSNEHLFWGFDSATNIDSGDVVNDGLWHMLTMTWGDGTGYARLYLDGVETSNTSDDGVHAFARSLYVCGLDSGGSVFADRYMLGDVDDFRVYNHSLSTEQIQALYNNRTDMIVSQELTLGDNWTGCILPNGDWEDSLNGEICRNITIIEPVTGCQVISTAGEYELIENGEGAPYSVSGITGITSACVVILASDVSFDCAGYSITNDGTATAAGIFANTSATNITIKNCPSISGYEHGVTVKNADGGALTNITSRDNTVGFKVNNAQNIGISNNTAYNNTNGFVLESGSQYNNITDSTSRNNTLYGFYLDTASNYNRLTDDLSHNNSYGFFFESSNYNNLTDSTAHNNTIDGFMGNNSYDLYLDPSKFKDNKGNGVNLNNCNGVTLSDLEITGNNGNGITMTQATTVGLDNLNVSDNQGHGLHMVQSDDITITQSTFCSNHQYGIRSQQGTNLQVSATDICDNTDHGIYLISTSGTTINQDEIFGNGDRGVFADNAANTFILYSHFYNNGYDIEASEDAASPSPFNATHIILDNPAGDYKNFTNISINDTLTSHAYTITWSSGSYSLPPNAISFGHRFVNISTQDGTPSIGAVTWYWSAGDLAGYTESMFELWRYSSGAWTMLNDTPDTIGHKFSLYNLEPASDYSILQANVTNITVYLNSPPDLYITMDTSITFNCSAATGSAKSLVNITLYGNWGGWHANETKTLTGTWNSTIFTKTFAPGTYTWNCLGFDNTTESDWGDANYTFTITNQTYELVGVNVTVLNTSKYEGNATVGQYELLGGNLTEANANLTISTEKWAGIYGNFSATLVLAENASSNFMYEWEWNTSAGGEICLTQNASPTWGLLSTAVKTQIDSAWGFDASDSDSANSTLTDGSALIYVAGATTPTTGTYLDASSNFQTGAFKITGAPSGEGDFAFCVNLTGTGTNYQNKSVMFEMIVPTTEGYSWGPLETYYVFAELS